MKKERKKKAPPPIEQEELEQETEKPVEFGVIYARYSAGSKQTEQSIEGQRRECMAYATSHKISIIKEYIDRKISGTTDNRAEFLQMIEDSKKRLFTVVVTYKTDRFSRDRYDAAVYKRALQKNGVRVAYARETIPDGPEGIVMEGMLEALAEYYSAELRQKITRGMIESAHKCKALGAMVFGYKKAPDGRYAINKKEAEVVRLIFQKYNEGMPLKDIARLAYPLGLATKGGDMVTGSRITKIVENPKYIGLYEAYGVRVEGGMPAIIDNDTWFLAQKRLDFYKHHKGEQGGRGHAKQPYLLSGKAFCGKCGSPLIGFSAQKPHSIYYYYNCRKQRKEHACTLPTMKKDWLEERIVNLTRRVLMDQDNLEKIVAGCLRMDEVKGNYEVKKRQLRRTIQKTEKSIQNAVAAITEGCASQSLKRKLDDLERQKALLSVEYNDLCTRPNISAQQLRFLFSQVPLRQGEDKETYNKRLIDIFVHSVTVFDKKIVVAFHLNSDSPRQLFTVEEVCKLLPDLTLLNRQYQLSTELFGASTLRTLVRRVLFCFLAFISNIYGFCSRKVPFRELPFCPEIGLTLILTLYRLESSGMHRFYSNFAVGRIATKSVISIMKQKGTNPRKSVIMESPQNQ